MRFPNSILIALFALLLGTAAPPASAETPLETLGRISAYADHCGYYEERQAMDAEFAVFDDYVDAKQKNDLSMYDLISGLNCGKVKAAIEKVLAAAAKIKASASSTGQE